MKKSPYLNLGCGSTFDSTWVNIDFVSNSEHVIAHNLLNGIPYPDNSFDFVYHSHVLEHFSKKDAPKFIEECYRVLKPGGVLRVVVPDLEQIALNYIKYLNESLANVPQSEKKYEWTILEMYDQVVREKSGGEMVEFIKDSSKNIDDFLKERNGKEIEPLLEKLRKSSAGTTTSTSTIRKLLSSIYHFKLKDILTKIVLGNRYKEYKESRFRKEGEIHQWMYDRYSLKNLLESKGFHNAEKKTAFTSYFNELVSYKLDGDNGVIRKPDSLFMEAIK